MKFVLGRVPAATFTPVTADVQTIAQVAVPEFSAFTAAGNVEIVIMIPLLG